eukprot:5784322-Prymnesium_polylepis.1
MSDEATAREEAEVVAEAERAFRENDEQDAQEGNEDGAGGEEEEDEGEDEEEDDESVQEPTDDESVYTSAADDEDEAAYENQPAAGLSPRLVVKRAVETLQ